MKNENAPRLMDLRFRQAQLRADGRLSNITYQNPTGNGNGVVYSFPLS